MKTAYIATTKELPDWFKLENYAKTIKFEYEPDYWHYELSTRLKLRDTWRVDKELNFENHWSLMRSWNKIKLYGLLAFAEKDEIDNKVHEMLMTKLNATPNNPPDEDREVVCATISTLNNFKAYGFWWFQSMKDEIENKFHINFREDLSKADSLVLKESFNWLWKPYSETPFYGSESKAYAEIEMNASDEQIKNDFAKWLAHERKRRNHFSAKKNFSEADCASWCDAAILPYLDLTFWSELEGVRIHQHVIAQAIFPDAYSLGSNVDPLGKLKTTKKKAEALMNEDALNVLELQIND